jgi:hypothetical protein
LFSGIGHALAANGKAAGIETTVVMSLSAESFYNILKLLNILAQLGR